MFWRLFWNVYAVVYDTISWLQPYRQMMRDLRIAAAPLPGEQVLDAGCGTGNLCRELERLAAVTGLDRAGAMLARARAKCPRSRFVAGDLARPLPFESGSFDAVCCSNVLYSLPDPVAALREFRRVLRPGGRIALSNPAAGFSMAAIHRAHLASGQGLRHWFGFLALLPALTLAMLLNLFVLRRVQKGSFYFFTPAELRELLAAAGFEQVEVASTYGGQGWCVKGLVPAARPAEAERVLAHA